MAERLEGSRFFVRQLCRYLAGGSRERFGVSFDSRPLRSISLLLKRRDESARVETFTGAACCQATELRTHNAAPLQALNDGSPHFFALLVLFAAIPTSRYLSFSPCETKSNSSKARRPIKNQTRRAQKQRSRTRCSRRRRTANARSRASATAGAAPAVRR